MSPQEIAAKTGEVIGTSEWAEMSQERINQFADATGDHQFIHINEEAAKMTPFGGTIAHGFLTLSLLPGLLAENGINVEGTVMGINYGSDKVRFLQPVPVGSRIRARQTLIEATEKRPGQWLNKTLVTIDIEGQPKPAMIAEFLAMIFVK